MSSTEAQLTPDTYYPSIDEEGKYIDKIPFNFNVAQGFYCPCGTRKEKICFTTKSKLSSHFKTNTHELWIANLNLNRHNHLIENEELKKIIQDQKLQISEQANIIAKQNFKINTQINVIHSLNGMITLYQKDINNMIEPETASTTDLIDFNFDIL